MRYRIAAALLGIAWAACAPAAEDDWIAAWASAQQIPEPQNSLPADSLHDATLRQVVHPALGGKRFRLRLSNAFGTAPLTVDSVTAARSGGPASPRIGTPSAVTFAGSPRVTIPAGADYLSDEIALDLPAGASLTVSLHLPEAPARQTGHPGAHATSYLLAGNHAADPDWAGAARIEHWYFLSGIDVAAPAGTAVVAAFGDSITDGHGATLDGDDRWPDDLARRGAATINLGIGGNHLLTDGLGPNALARFDRDVLARPGVRSVIVLEGINDIGGLARETAASAQAHADLVARMIAAYVQLIERAHDHGVRAIGGTLTPFAGSDYYHPDAATEADRQAVNRWIRQPGHFDAVIDFDQVTRDPKDPSRLRPDYDCGDHLHPSPSGYRAMAEAIPLALVSAEQDLAITIDDLPVHNALPPGETRLSVAERMIAALRDANVPKPYGFVNAGPIAENPSLGAVLDAWRAAGFRLGNHTWSHADLDKLPAADFESGIVRDEAALQGGQDWHWFRYPFLDEGHDPAKRAEIRRFLKERGYRIAAVTMNFNDFLWNEPYARCMAAHDDAGVAELERSYLAAARQAADDARRLSPGIPYVLLMHVGAFDARMMPKLLAQYREQGFRFVTLPEAERNYDDAVTPPLPPAPVDAGKLAGFCVTRP